MKKTDDTRPLSEYVEWFKQYVPPDVSAAVDKADEKEFLHLCSQHRITTRIGHDRNALVVVLSQHSKPLATFRVALDDVS